MFGFAFSVFWLGIFLGVILYLLRYTRRFYTFAFIPIFGSVGAIILCLLASTVLEYLVSNVAGGYGFFGGYTLGGILGALGGLKIAQLATYRSAKLRNAAEQGAAANP